MSTSNTHTHACDDETTLYGHHSHAADDAHDACHTTEPAECNVGPAGPQGAMGATGLTGPAGEQGVKGCPGSACHVHGPVGPAGPEGPVGSGEQGPVGPRGGQGKTGCEGPKGDEGCTGPKGDRGPSGLKGDKGCNGDQGHCGPRGETGVAGPTGCEGPRGYRGRSCDEPGPCGPRGERGCEGPKGDQGETGAVGCAGPSGTCHCSQMHEHERCNPWTAKKVAGTYYVTYVAQNVDAQNVLGEPDVRHRQITLFEDGNVTMNYHGQLSVDAARLPTQLEQNQQGMWEFHPTRSGVVRAASWLFGSGVGGNGYDGRYEVCIDFNVLQDASYPSCRDRLNTARYIEAVKGHDIPKDVKSEPCGVNGTRDVPDDNSTDINDVADLRALAGGFEGGGRIRTGTMHLMRMHVYDFQFLDFPGGAVDICDFPDNGIGCVE
jgi:hypothetical protein